MLQEVFDAYPSTALRFSAAARLSSVQLPCYQKLSASEVITALLMSLPAVASLNPHINVEVDY